MQALPYVSVIVPIYNQQRYLRDCLRCLQWQTHQNLQILAVNDGSTDASGEILREFAAADARIEVLEQPNGGLVSALLRGIAAARGEWICFVDPDDLVGEELVASFVAGITDGCDLVATGFYYDFEGTVTPHPLREDAFYDADALRQMRNCFVPQDHTQAPLLFHARWNKLYRTALVQKIAAHLSQHRHITMGEDSLFTYLALCYADGATVLCRPNQYYYNVSNASSMVNAARDTYLQKINAVRDRLTELTYRFGTDPAVAQQLYRNLLAGLENRPAPLAAHLKYSAAARLARRAKRLLLRLLGRPAAPAAYRRLRGRLRA